MEKLEEVEDKDPLLYTAQAAELAGISAATWRSYLRKGLVPEPDDPDADRPENRRMPRWRKSSVLFFKQNRIGRGRLRPGQEGRRCGECRMIGPHKMDCSRARHG